MTLYEFTLLNVFLTYLLQATKIESVEGGVFTVQSTFMRTSAMLGFVLMFVVSIMLQFQAKVVHEDVYQRLNGSVRKPSALILTRIY